MRNRFFTDNLKKKFKLNFPATSLVETIVSSIIFMIIFIIAMDALTNLLVYDQKNPNYIIVENDLKKCRRTIEKEGIDENMKEHYYSYKWGKIKVSVSPYKDDFLLINMTSQVVKGQSIGYKFLYANQE